MPLILVFAVNSMNVASSFEQYRMKLVAMTHNMKESVDLMEYMKHYAETTPFNVEELDNIIESVLSNNG